MILPALVRSRRASSAAEFALVVIPLMAMVMGSIEFARLQWTRNALQEVASASARCVGMKARLCGTATTDASGKTTYSYNAATARTFTTAQAAAWSLSLPTAEIAIAEAATCQGVSGFAQVTLTHAFKSGFLAAAGANNYPITAVACFPNQT